MRATTEQLSQVTNLLGARLGAADRDGHDPPRRGAAAPAAGRDGRGHHLDRRRHQARDLLRRAARPGPGRLGRQLPERGAGRAWTSARGCCRRKLTDAGARRRASARSCTRSRRRSRSSRRPPETPSTWTGAARLLSEQRFQELPAALRPDGACSSAAWRSSRVLRASLAEPSVYLRIGSENEAPELRSLSDGGGQLRPGAPQPRRGERDRPGADGLPARRSSPCARRPPSCRASSARCTPNEARRLRGPRASARGADGAGDQEGVPRRSRASCIPDVNADDPHAEEKFKEAAEAYEVLSDPERRRSTTATAATGSTRAATPRTCQGFGSFADIFDAFFGGDPFGGGGAAARVPCRAATSAVEVEISLEQAAARHRGARSRTTRVEAVRALPRQRRRARHADRDLRALRRDRRSCARSRAPPSASSSAPRSATSAAARARSPRTPCEECARARAQGRPHARSTVDMPAGIADDQRIRLDRPRPRGRARRPARRPLRARARGRGRALPARRQRPDRRGRRARAGRGAGTTVTVPTLDGEEEIEVEPGTQPGHRGHAARARACPASAAAARGDQQVVLNVVIPRNLTAGSASCSSELRESARPSDNLPRPTPSRCSSKVKRAFR